MSEEEIYIGKGAEAAVTVVGRSGLVGDPQRVRVFTSDNPEYIRYSELLAGYMEKLTRWQEILNTDQCESSPVGYRGFDVLVSDSGSTIHGDKLRRPSDPQDKVLLYMRNRASVPAPGYGNPHAKFVVQPRPAGEHLLTDLEDNKTLRMVEIDVDMIEAGKTSTGEQWKSITIKTEREGRIPRGRLAYRQARYEFIGDTLTVKHLYPHPAYDTMPDEMVTSLINTIDSLIPTQATPPLGLRTALEIQPPKTIPHARNTTSVALKSQ